MGTRHTPKSWHLDDSVRPARVVEGGRIICEIPHHADGSDLSVGRMIAASPELLTELRHAHQIILNARAVMNEEQAIAWATQNQIDGCDGEGATRYHERKAAVQRALGEPS